MSVTLFPEINDVAKYLPEHGSFVLSGIHKNGVTDWNGVLPNDDVYEVWVKAT